MSIRKSILVVFLSFVLASCVPVLVPASRPNATVGNMPLPTDTPTATNWKDRIRECVREHSFLVALLPELNRYQGNTNPIQVSISITPTVRGCITLPEDLYPVTQREFISREGDALLGYVSNWEPVCGGIHTGPLPGNCTGDGYEGGGTGTTVLRAKSTMPNVPDLVFRFAMETTPHP
jgi:hypothetical protein